MDFRVILEECGYGKDAASMVLKRISDYSDDVSENVMSEFCEYILTNIYDAELILGTIKIAESYRSSQILSRLMELLLLKNIEATDTEDFVNVRVLCAKAIANYKDTSAVGTLLYCLNNKSENYKIRLACADTLGRIGDRYAVAPLIDVVQDENEKSVYVKESATFALGLLGDASAIDPLVAIMEAKQGFLGKFSFLKERIVEALGRLNINNDKVLKVLKNSLLDSSPMVRINAIEALMNSDYENAASLIRTTLNDDDDEVKRNALIALYNLLGRDILDEIIALPVYSDFLKYEAQVLLDEYEEDE